MTRTELLGRLRRVRVLALDVDGVLTDGGMYYGPRGETLKKFNVKDGLGLRLVGEAGITVAFITGERSPAVSRRAEKLGVREVFLGVRDKGKLLDGFLSARRLAPSSAAYVGDDLTDLAPMSQVGVAIAVADATPSVRKVADWITTRRGGDAAVREVCDALLESLKNSPRIVR